MSRRAADALQFGLLPGRAVEAAELSPPLLRLLIELAGTWRVDELLARAVALGASQADAHALLTDLCAAGVLVDATLQARMTEHRSRANVLVSGDGPLAARVTSVLATAGITRLTVDAQGRVEAGEIGGFAAADVGGSRAASTAAEVHRVAPSARVRTGPPHRRPDLAILVDQLRPDSERHPILLARQVPRLVVRLADDVGLVGPLILARRSACLRCIDLHRAAQDPCWPTVVAGLGNQVGSASPATSWATAALAAEQALLALDSMVAPGQPPPTLDAVLELDLRRGELRRREWTPHPRCGCGAAHTRSLEAETGHPTSKEPPPPEEAAAEKQRVACAKAPQQ